MLLQEQRKAKARVEALRRQNALQEQNLKKKAVSDIYHATRQREMNKNQRRADGIKKGANLAKAMLILKISGAAALLLFLGLTVNSLFRSDRGMHDVPILCLEEPATGDDADAAMNYIKQIVGEVAADGIKALGAHWSPAADEEARYYAESKLPHLDAAAMSLKDVQSLPSNHLKVKCEYGGHPVSFLLIKGRQGMSLAAVN